MSPPSFASSCRPSRLRRKVTPAAHTSCSSTRASRCGRSKSYVGKLRDREIRVIFLSDALKFFNRLIDVTDAHTKPRTQQGETVKTIYAILVLHAKLRAMFRIVVANEDHAGLLY
jgi:hypothetical protein